MNTNTRIFLPIILAIVLMAGILIGTLLNPAADAKKSLFYGADYDRLEEILKYIDMRYVDTIDTERIIGGMVEDYLEQDETIDAIFKNLDPHSNYIPSENLRQVNEDLEGNFDGIGVEFNIISDTILVVSPISGGPSERLGIQSGDKIITIDDSLVAGIDITYDDVIGKLRGVKGTEVSVGIYRPGNEELIHFSIVRDEIPIYSLDVAYMVDSRIGYLKLNRFSRTTFKEFEEGIRKLEKEGMKKLILDLRGNPGGYLMAATKIADDFLSGRKLIVYTEGKATGRYEYEAGKTGMFEQGDVVVLIDEGSASASEIVAGALQDHKRAMVVGRRSFGKGLVQEIYELKDSSAIKLTIARYYTPGGRCIQRSYERGVDAYYEDYMARLMNGGEIPDSLRELGQQLWGIIPDIITSVDTSADKLTFNKLFNRGLIRQFSYDYYSRNPAIFQSYTDVAMFSDSFEISDRLFARFEQYLKEQDFQLEKESINASRPEIEIAMKAFMARQAWKNEGYYPIFHQIDDDFLTAYSAIKEGTRAVVKK